VFHVDGQTDRHDEANSRFSQFSEAPNDWLVSEGKQIYSYFRCSVFS
jgi:hypothetical protein